MAAAALLVASALVLAVHLASTGVQASLPAGRIVSGDLNGTVLLSNPQGLARAWLPGFGTFTDEGLVVAQDDHLVVTSTGVLIAVRRQSLDATGLTVRRVATLGLAGFADHDRALAGLDVGGSRNWGIAEVVPIDGGEVVALGQADGVAADPASPGAFVTLPSLAQPGNPPPAGGYAGAADARVELRDAGRRPVVLATSAQLEGDLREAAGPVNLEVFPDRQGDKVAVLVNPVAAGEANAGVVVLSRSGGVLGAVRPQAGPLEYSQPAWSPDGTALAFATSIDNQSQVSVWHVDGPVYTRPAPDIGAALNYCLWSSTGDGIMCASTDFGAAGSTQWVAGNAGRHPLRAYSAPGLPLAWLIGGG